MLANLFDGLHLKEGRMNPLQTCFVDEDNQLLTTIASDWQPALTEKTKVKLNDRDYQVSRSYFAVNAKNQTLGYYVVLKEIKPGWFERLSEDNQFFLSAILAAPTLGLLGAGLLVYYLMPDLVAPILGWGIRPVVAISLIGTGLLIANQIKDGYVSEHPTLLGSYLYVLSIWVGLLAAFIWLSSTVPAKPLVVWPTDYAAYLNALRVQFEPIWPIILGLLPWLVFVLNILGLEPIAKVFEFLRGRAKG
jgi:hypothetical protein